MLSVLITTYNWSSFFLIKRLHQQLEKAQITFEIICIDDASKSELNKENEAINFLSNCNFKSLDKNIGRSALRNLLVSKSKYNWLLFLDGDVLPTSNTFIQKYITEIQQVKISVFLGGIRYRDVDNKNSLRWKLGRKGEERLAIIRNENPYNYFFTGNFLIKKELFNSVKFDEKLTQYGYEDLLFAKELEQQNIPIKHIDNPVFHLGIDDNKTFVIKTKQALENLSLLLKSNQVLKEDTKVSNLFFKLKWLGLGGVLSEFSNKFELLAIKKSSLFYYNLFRLGYLHKVFKDVN